MTAKILNGLRILYRDILRITRRELRFYGVIPNTSTLFLTYRCNSKCKTCTFWTRPAKEEKEKEIGFDEWKAIIDKLHVAGIRFTEIFGGNVLLRKDLLISVLKYLYEKDFTIHMPTNQIGLDDEIAEAIISYASVVYISTDGIGELQDSIRGQNGASQRAEDSIDKLIRIKQGRGDKLHSSRLVCNTTVSKYNIDILDKVVEYALMKKFDEIHFEYVGEFSQEYIDNSVVEGIRPEPYFVKQDESALVDREGAKRLKEVIKNIKKKYANEAIEISTINIDILSEENLYKGTITHKKCYTERNEVTVDPSGNVIICPFIGNYVMGNLLESTFDDIWNNEKHKSFRYNQNRGDLEMCAHCILGVQRNPGVFTSLKRSYLTHIEPKLLNL